MLCDLILKCQSCKEEWPQECEYFDHVIEPMMTDSGNRRALAAKLFGLGHLGLPGIPCPFCGCVFSSVVDVQRPGQSIEGVTTNR